MARSKVDKVMQDIKATLPNLEPEQLKAIEKTMEDNFPNIVYSIAIVFLGLVTLFLASGGIFLAIKFPGTENAVPDALWLALGAGLGGLAGIFSGNK